MPKPYPKDKSETLDALLLQGASNEEIKRVMGPVSKDILYSHRKRLHLTVSIRNNMSLEGEPQSKPNHLKQWPGGCPKCSGLPIRGGLVNLSYSPHYQRCTVCGLTNESESYYDAHSGARVGI